MHLAHKIRLSPNNKQITYFKKACGVSRFAWNWGLARWKELYENGQKPTGFNLSKEFNSIKKDKFPFVLEVTKYASQHSFIQLQSAWQRYFNSLNSNEGNRINPPKFKKKGKSKDSFYIGGDQIVLNKSGTHVKIPKLGYVKLTERVRYEGKILNAVISRQADNWFISFTIEPLISFLPCKNHASVGVDVGSKSLVTLSNGVKILSPKPLNTAFKKLRRESRRLSRKQKDSNNYNKQVIKLARIHQRISNIRKDILHKLTTFLTDNFEYITIENLNVKGILSNRNLARTIADLGFYEFKRQLVYKSELKGNKLTIANRWYPSSKICSCCGNIKQDLKLNERIYKCDVCSYTIDRDLNAAINLNKLNILPQALREVTPVEIVRKLDRQGLVYTVVEAGRQHQPMQLDKVA